MKDRLLVAGIGIPVLLIIFLVMPAWGTLVATALICGVAVYELLYKVNYLNNIRIIFVTTAMAFFVCTWSYLGAPSVMLRIGLFAFSMYLFVEFLSAKLELPLGNLLVALFGGVLIPYLFSSIIRIRIMENGVYFILLPFVMTMVPDAGAYAAGSLFGKTKLTPIISPHKTVEGVYGGAAAGVLAVILYGIILQFGFGFRVNYFYCAVYGLLGSVCSVIGDLVFSAIKRQKNVKDFSRMLPGHGGALDRFDSAITTAPLAEILLLLIPIAVK